MQVAKILNIAALFFAAFFGRPAFAQSPPVAAERPMVILVTKDRLHISTNDKLHVDAGRNEIKGDALVIRCNTCELNRQETAKEPITFHCQGNVLVEGYQFKLHANSISRIGSRLVAVGTAEKSAMLWTARDADKKKTSFSAGGRIAFDIEKGTIEVDDASVLDLDRAP